MTQYLLPVKQYEDPIADLGLHTDCPLCGWHASVNRPGHHTSPGCISLFHMTKNGASCPAAGMAITLEAAIARDNRLTPQEKAVQAWVWRQEMACKGFDETGEPCSHPVCAGRHKAAVQPSLFDAP